MTGVSRHIAKQPTHGTEAHQDPPADDHPEMYCVCACRRNQRADHDECRADDRRIRRTPVVYADASNNGQNGVDQTAS